MKRTPHKKLWIARKRLLDRSIRIAHFRSPEPVECGMCGQPITQGFFMYVPGHQRLLLTGRVCAERLTTRSQSVDAIARAIKFHLDWVRWVQSEKPWKRGEDGSILDLRTSQVGVRFTIHRTGRSYRLTAELPYRDTPLVWSGLASAKSARRIASHQFEKLFQTTRVRQLTLSLPFQKEGGASNSNHRPLLPTAPKPAILSPWQPG